MSVGERRKPGLKAIYDGREQRKPGGKYGRPTTAVYLLGVSAILASLVVHHFVNEHQLSERKSAMLAQRNALNATIGAEWAPLRDAIEKYVLASAKDWKGDFVAPEARTWDFRSEPGIYLRMRVADAKDVESLRRAAAESQKDAFTGCFLREPNAPAVRGDADAGAFPEQPWNLGKAYAATRVLGDDWGDAMKQVDDDMPLRVYEGQLAKAEKVDMKLAAEMVKKAKFFLLVLDEDAPDARKFADGGAIDEAAIQMVPHDARVHVLDLRSNKEIARVKREGSASFRFMGEHAVDDETQAAMQRQVNNCALADEVKAAIAATGDAGAP